MSFDISSLQSKLVEFALSERFWASVAVLFLVAFFRQLRDAAWRLLYGAWEWRNKFDLSGYWAGECELPTVSSHELWRYSLTRHSVKLVLYSYTSVAGEKPKKWIGGGVFRGNRLSAYYYLEDPNAPESGTITMELRGRSLIGVYAQFDPKLIVSKRDYEQVRVNLTRRERIKMRVKMLFGVPPVGTREDVVTLIKKAKRQREVPGAPGPSVCHS
jgi:hypothetical protein